MRSFARRIPHGLRGHVIRGVGEGPGRAKASVTEVKASVTEVNTKITHVEANTTELKQQLSKAEDRWLRLALEVSSERRLVEYLRDQQLCVLVPPADKKPELP
ncbi:hypothetical protein HYH03_013512 [Edaphochlamys debaryana]|uniref:Uncharacterized protein n=1 Tax=Edaphochlamys debaryana TaxID=47281 RepID=A0A836BUF8_9CHLO|nr:hypothetical protein HYH03_013512 [Edaphochlamys debaryana]|eukprot:KAG2487933.1 hypothetical protein HYH03_013512 [Edaphochlamys debaryana]